MKKLIAAETVLYLVFMGMDLFGIGNSTPVKFAAILLLALSALDFREKTVSFALILTAIADVFLLVLDKWYIAGVACFLLVQVLYAARLCVKDGSWARILMFLLPIAAGLIIYTSYGLGLTEALAAAYITLCACNLVQAVGRARRDPQRKWLLFAFGLALFFCCDLCVGLHNMPGAGGEALQRFAAVAMGGFYLPGQVLISTSAYIEN